MRDMGEGIRAEDLSRSLRSLLHHQSLGHGLGLAISQRIVENAGGRLEVSSRQQEGSVFTVRLPAVSRKAPNASVGANAAS